MAHHPTGNPYGEKPRLPPLPRGIAPRIKVRANESRADAVARAEAARQVLCGLMRR